MVESAVIREMLDELRFDEIERLIEQGGSDPDPELRVEIDRRRAEAEDRADSLAQRVIELGNERRLEEIIELAGEPSTGPLLDLAPESPGKRASLYIQEAERWAEKQHETNGRRLAEARHALDGLDLQLANGLMNRIDGRYLSEEQERERDQLLLDISARSLELESIAEAGRQLAEDEGPDGTDRDRPWWRRWFG